MGNNQRLLFAATLLLLTFTFTDNALWDYNTPNDLWQQYLPLGPQGFPEPVQLKWKNKALYILVCRSVTMNGVHPIKAFDKLSFSHFHVAFVRNAGYSDTPTYQNPNRFDKISVPNFNITKVRGWEITGSPQNIQMVPDQSYIIQPAESVAITSASARTPMHVDMDSLENTSATFSKSPSAGPIMRAKARIQNSCMQSHSSLLSAPHRARPYSPEEDRFLRQLMRCYISQEITYSAFQRRFSNRTLSSLRYQQLKIQHLEKPSPKARLKQYC